MKRLTLLLPIMLLACAKPRTDPLVIHDPVAAPCPPPTIPARPAMPSAQLPQAPALRDLVRALLADREALAAWALDLETRLKAYLSSTKETQ